MAEYEMLPEVNLSDLPERIRGRTREVGKWQKLLDPLAFDKAIPFLCETAQGSERLWGKIKQAMIRKPPAYKVHRRRIRLLLFSPDGKCILYVWKEEIKGGGPGG